MPNVMDYIAWRGDLTFEESPLCEVDNLIFCLLSYVDLDGIVPESPKQGRVTLRQAAMAYFFDYNPQKPRPLGLIVPAEIHDLFRQMAHARRYRDLWLTGYVNEINEAREMQFSALTVYLEDETLFVAIRGTDDTIVGWREDFNLSYMDEVPSQKKAVDYLNTLDLTPASTLYVGGHSKGGNLAVWGAVHADESVRARVKRVYSNDGPGFTEGTVASEAYRSMADRIVVLLPESSLVGLLLEHGDDYTVIKSNRRGLFQHDGLSWEVLGGSFVRTDSLSKRGMRADTVVRERIDSMSRGEKQAFVKLMFGILESTGAKTLTELYNGKIKTAITMLKSFTEMSREDKEMVSYLWDKLFGSRTVLTVDKEKKSTGKKTEAPVKQPRKKSRRGRVQIEFFPWLRT